MSIPAGEENGFWVAEARNAATPSYWTGRHHEDHEPQLTCNIHQAIRFRSQEAAQAMIEQYELGAILEATEHMWFGDSDKETLVGYGPEGSPYFKDR